MRPLQFLLLTGLLLIALHAGATDVLKERRWAEQLRDGLLSGEALELSADGRPFLAIDTPASGEPVRGAVILLHGMGAHPDWPEVIHPLRVELAEAGWRTLAIQLPVLANDANREAYAALFPDALARIQAAIGFLQEAGATGIAIVGHSLGAAMGAAFVAQKGEGDGSLKAFVGIGMPAGSEASLARITLPVLDLYGAQDLDGVRASAPRRRGAAREAGNTRYRQSEIPGADHFFTGLDATLVSRVDAWLRRQVTTKETAAP